jgi:hypothetical protein
MAVVAPNEFEYIRRLHQQGQLTITRAEAVVGGLRVSASASIILLTVNIASREGYEELVVDFLVTFNSPVAGMLQEISITVSAPPVSGVTPLIHFCSTENMPIPSGAVRVTKRFIVRWYTS